MPKQLNDRRDVIVSANAFPGCKIHKFGVSQVIPHSTITVCDTMNDVYDPYGWAGGSPAFDNITPDIDADFMLIGWVYFESSVAQYDYMVRIHVDGVMVASALHSTLAASDVKGAMCTKTIMPLTAGQVVDLNVRQFSGGNRTMNGSELVVIPLPLYT